MKLWISGEIDSTIGESFRVARNYLEQKVNDVISLKNYGSGILSWDVIIVISKSRGKEEYKYNPKKKETDIHIVIDFDHFDTSNSISKQLLLLDALIHSIDKLETLEILDFNFKQLKNDLLNIEKTIFSNNEN